MLTIYAKTGYSHAYLLNALQSTWPDAIALLSLYKGTIACIDWVLFVGIFFIFCLKHAE